MASVIMKNRAPNVFRWTERMNMPALNDGEFQSTSADWFDGDGIPPTLEKILALIFRDWTPELAASAVRYHQWLTENPSLPSGTLVSESGDREVHPSLGEIAFELCGQKVTKACSAQTLWHFGKVLDQVASLDDEAAKIVKRLLAELGGEGTFKISFDRAIVREQYALVLA